MPPPPPKKKPLVGTAPHTPTKDAAGTQYYPMPTKRPGVTDLPPIKGAIGALAWLADQPDRALRYGVERATDLPEGSGATKRSLVEAQLDRIASNPDTAGWPGIATPEARRVTGDLAEGGLDIADPINIIPPGAIEGLLGKGITALAESSAGPLQRLAKSHLDRSAFSDIKRINLAKGERLANEFNTRFEHEFAPLLKPVEDKSLFMRQLESPELIPPQHQSAVQAFRSIMDDAHKAASEAGLDIEKVPNYVHRPYEKFDEAIEPILTRPTTGPTGLPGKPPPLKARTQDIPLLSDHPLAKAADTSPGNIAARYTQGVFRRGVPAVGMVNDLKQLRGLPPGAALSPEDQKMVREALFGSDLVEGTTRAVKDKLEGTWVGSGVEALGNLRQGLVKNILLRNPGFYVRSKMENSLQNVLHGLTAFPETRANSILKAAEKGDPQALKVIEDFAAQGGPAPSTSATKLGVLDTHGDVTQAINRAAGMQSPKMTLQSILSGSAVDEKLPWLDKIGMSPKNAQNMEFKSKLGTFASALEQGLDPAAAMKKTLDAQVNMHDKGPVGELVAKFAPAKTFWLKGPAMVAKGVADHPARAKLILDASQQLAADPNGNTAPSYMSDSTLPIPLPEPVKKGISSAREAVGGTAIPPEDTLWWKSPHPMSGLEMLGDVVSSLKKDRTAAAADAVRGMFPEFQAGYTAITGVDPQTKKEIPSGALPWLEDTASRFGSSVVPTTAQAPLDYASEKLGGPQHLFRGNPENQTRKDNRTPEDDLVDRLMGFAGLTYKQSGPEQESKNDYFQTKETRSIIQQNPGKRKPRR